MGIVVDGRLKLEKCDQGRLLRENAYCTKTLKKGERHNMDNLGESVQGRGNDKYRGPVVTASKMCGNGASVLGMEDSVE